MSRFRERGRGVWAAHRSWRLMWGTGLLDAMLNGWPEFHASLRDASELFGLDCRAIRNAALVRYFRIYNGGYATVDQWNEAVSKYTDGRTFSGKGSCNVYRKLDFSAATGARITGKRFVLIGGKFSARGLIHGRSFFHRDINARVARYKEYLALKDQRDELRARREARRIIKAAQDAHSACQLYRHFDESGRLLYVGISNNHVNRLAAHRCDSAWFPLIASITVEHFDSRAAALKAEWAAIKSERPIFNRMHNDYAYELWAA